jgi:hypothetical protein
MSRASRMACILKPAVVNDVHRVTCTCCVLPLTRLVVRVGKDVKNIAEHRQEILLVELVCNLW